MNTRQIVNESYQCLVATNNASIEHSQLLAPSDESNKFLPSPSLNDMQNFPVNTTHDYHSGLQNKRADTAGNILDGINILADIAKLYIYNHDREKVNDARRMVKSNLDQLGGVDTEYELDIEIELGGKVKINSVIPKNAPRAGEKPSYVRRYNETIIIKTKQPERQYTPEDPLVSNSENELNREYYREKDIEDFNRRVRDDIPERVFRKLQEYVDPSTEEEVKRWDNQA